MTTTLTIDQYKLATSRRYINELMGKRVAYTTPSGTRVEGTITPHPMIPKLSSHLAVTTDDGHWASLGWNDTVELMDA